MANALRLVATTQPGDAKAIHSAIDMSNCPQAFRTLVLLLAALMLFTASGCDRTDQALHNQKTAQNPKGLLVGSKITPINTVKECVSAYERLTSYEDTAFVQLSYKLDGKPQQDRAPLCIAWEKDGGLGFRVYSVQAGPTGGRWHLKIEDASPGLDNQVLVRALPKKWNFQWLLSDPIVAEQLAAGLAGFPPQLDLLLSEKPFEGLLGAATDSSFGERVTIDNAACHQIVLAHGNLEYRLFVDQASMLMRRMTLPTNNLPRAMLADPRVSDLALTIEFENVRTNSAVSWKRFATPAPRGTLQVNRFVAEPPQIETAGIGKQVPGFTLNDANGNVVFDSKSKRKATVLLWLANHPASELAARELASAHKRLADSGVNQQIQYIPIWTEPTPPSNMTFQGLQDSWQLPNGFAIDSQALGRDLFGVEEAPTMVVIDASSRVQLRITKANPNIGKLLPDLLSRVVAGENLADSIMQENDLLTSRYVAELRMATAVSARVGHQDSFYTSYAPVAVNLNTLEQVAHAESVVACGMDPAQSTWLLDHEGNLALFKNGISNSANQKFATPWNAQPGDSLAVSVDQKFVALWSINKSSLEIFDTATGQNRVVTLESDEHPVDLRWTELKGSPTPRLSFVTNTGMLMLLDPTNHEQLSGRCPTRPLALISAASQSGQVDDLVVLQDRSVQPMQLSEESTQHDFPLLPKSQTPSIPSTLDFAPAAGPWLSCSRVDHGTFTLARGWVAKDEPALFVLDAQFKPRWHRRIGLQEAGGNVPIVATAVDPATGLPTWIYADEEQTIYLLRADGVTDHFRLADRFIGLTLGAEGTRLVMNVIRQNATQRYSLTWKQFSH